MSFLEIENFTHKNSKAHYNPDRPGQVQHIYLDLNLDIEKEILFGVSNVKLKLIQDNLKFLEIDAVEMQIQDVSVNQKPVEFSYDGHKIKFNIENLGTDGEILEIAVSYSTEKPKLGITFIKPTEFYPQKPTQVWASGESEQSRYWYPCFDYPKQISTSEIRIKLPSNLITVSNGDLLSSEVTGGVRTDHWLQSKPHPNYLINIVAGDFVEIKDSWKGLPVNYYADKSLEAELKLTAVKTPKMIEFFSKKFGVDYPWNKYSQTWVHDFIWGGMENTNATVNTDRALVDKRAIIDYTFGEILVAHELSHQWFGDYVVIEHWSELWIKEGMATYSESLWIQEEYGQDEFDYYRFLEVEEYLEEAKNSYKRPTILNVYEDAEDLYDRHSYTKAGCIYHMISSAVGNSANFTKVLQIFLEKHAHQNVEARDLVKAVDEVTGKNILPLLDQYIYRAGHPDFKISYSWDSENKLAKLTVEQKQASSEDDRDNLFNLPKVPVGFGYLKENKFSSFTEFSLDLSKKLQTFYFPLKQKPDFVSFDLKNSNLKDVELDLPFPELKNQLELDPNVASRIQAARAIAKKGNLESLKSLANSLVKDSFWGVRSEIARLFSKFTLDQSQELLVPALNDSDARVRKSALESLGSFKIKASYDIVKSHLESGDPSYFVSATNLKVLGEIANWLSGDYLIETLEILEKTLKTPKGWNDVVHSGAIAGLGKLNESEKATDLILENTKPGISQSLRYNAIVALGSVANFQSKATKEKIIETLKSYSGGSNISLESSLISSLSKINSAKAIPILQYISGKTLYGRNRKAVTSAIESVQKSIGTQSSIKKITKDLEEMKKSNQELKSRLEELEAKKTVVK